MSNGIQQLIANSVSGIFDRVEDAYHKEDIVSHLNESVAYVELYSYTSKQSEHDYTGVGHRIYEAVYRLTALGSRTMSAVALTDTVDSRVFPAIHALDIKLLGVTRHACEYVREQSRYRISVDIKVKFDVSTEVYAHSVLFNSVVWNIFNSVSVKNSVKMYELGRMNGTTSCGVSRIEPAEIILKGDVSLEGAMNLYQTFASQRASVQTVTIDGVSFNSMMLCDVSCHLLENKGVVTLKFKEVCL